jgi:pimeloyl-ACP methyl ester carboxylesterase
LSRSIPRISKSLIAEGETVSISMIADDVVGYSTSFRSDAHILGISFGGFVALDLVLRFPGA